MKHLIVVLFLVSVQWSFAQHVKKPVIIDTANTTYQKKLKATYLKRISAQKAQFKKRFKRRVWKEADNLYDGATGVFLEKIDRGYFVDDPHYRSLLNEIQENLAANNPEYARKIKNTKILLSYGRAPNAYAIGNDIVVVFIPLIKSISNEYEL